MKRLAVALSLLACAPVHAQWVLSHEATPGPLNPIAPGTVGAKKMDHICRLARQLG